MPGDENIAERAAKLSPADAAMIEALGTGGFATHVPEWAWLQSYVRRAVRTYNGVSQAVFEMDFRGEELMREMLRVRNEAALKETGG